MSHYFFSLEMLVLQRYQFCGDDEECVSCDGMRQQLYDLAREENR